MQPYIMISLIIICILLLILIILTLSSQKSVQNTLKHELTVTESTTQKNLNESLNALSDRLDSRMHDLMDRNTNFERHNVKTLEEFSKNLAEVLRHQQSMIEKRLDKIDERVSHSLNEGFEKTNKTFTNIVERLGKIDEAQKKIDALSVEIVSLQDVLTDKKTRGAFGEVQLNQILASIFGDRNDQVYQLQYTYQNGFRSDAVLFAPEPLGTLAIDAKFPLENYRKMIEAPFNSPEYTLAKKAFTNDCKLHIDDIARKYIVLGETSDQAILFLPAEAVFATLNAYHPDIIDYAQRKRVWITSPTTLMATLTTLQTILLNIKRDQYTVIIQEELAKLSTEFIRYKARWDALSTRIEQVGKEVKDIHTTTNKITKRFESIANVSLDHDASLIEE